MFPFRRIRRTRKGQFQLRLPPEERELLRSLPAQLRELLGTDDPALERLFPPAYTDDPAGNEEYRQLMRDDLVQARVGALDVMEATVDAEHLDEDQVTAWLSALNDLRLVLGTRLDVTEDMYDDPPVDPGDARAAPFAIYTYLGWLEEQVVEALAAGLPDEGAYDDA